MNLNRLYQRMVAKALAEIFVLVVVVLFLIVSYDFVEWWGCLILSGILVVFHAWLWKE